VQLYLASGRVHVDVIGNDGAPLVVGMPGLTSGGSQLAVFATTAIDAGLRFVAVDLRGRGGSEWTGPGTYGWESHARDVLEVVDALGVDRFSVVGASMGAGRSG
jgi:pimeloyl-ACP methyl ester carboxylesterase